MSSTIVSTEIQDLLSTITLASASTSAAAFALAGEPAQSAEADSAPWYAIDSSAESGSSSAPAADARESDAAFVPTALPADATAAEVVVALMSAGPLSQGASVTHDETSGLQNLTATPTPASDADDNDTSLTLPSVFAARLTALSAGTAMGAALSGYNGAVGNTGSAAFTIAAGGPAVTDVKFMASDGTALNGLDSGLDTVNGTSVLLYTDTSNNNIVLGRAGAGGPIVFAAYIDQIGTAPAITGGKIWLVQYQALKHTDPDPLNHDDALNLLNKVFVGIEQEQQFSLANAPSGQNLFLMFTVANPTIGADGRIAEVAIIATGKTPVIGANGQFTNDSDTINTSQAGGPTTFGTNSQMITEQEGVRFTFVTGARANVTIPNLDQGEADVEANIDYTAHFGARSAQFDVVQLQSGKSAQVKITAINNNDGAGDATLFVDGYADDASEVIAITRIQVRNTASGAVLADSAVNPNANGLSITLATGLITGVKAGQTISYTTASDHTRVLVENGAATNASGNTHADFDIGGFRLLQQTSAMLEVGSLMIFDDDGPITTLDAVPTSPPPVTVDETDLPGGATTPFATATLFIPGTPNRGADGGTASVTSVFTTELTTPANPDSGLVDTLSGDKIYLFADSATNTITGRVGLDNDGGADASGAIAFTISINPSTGAGTLTQHRAVVHDDPLDPDETGASAAEMNVGLFTVTRTDTVTDSEGDSFTAAPVSVAISDLFAFEDDGPSIDANANATPTLTTDDSDIPHTAGPTPFAGLFNTPDFGKDGFKDSDDNDIEDADALGYALGINAGASGLTDTLTGNAVVLSLESGVVYGRAGALEVFRISVNADTGAVTLLQSRSVVHDDPSDPEEANSPAGLAAANLVTLTATVTDGDGDTDSATRNIGDAFNFEDDGPSIVVNTTAAADPLTVDETVLATNASADFSDNYANVPDFGEDGGSSIDSAYALSVSAAGADSGLDDTATGANVLLYLEGGQVVGRAGSAAGAIVFTVSVNVTGTVTLDQQRAVVHPDATDHDDSTTLGAADLIRLTRTDTITDGDGDTNTGSAVLHIAQALNFEDDGPSIAVNTVAAADPLTVDETVLATNASADFSDNYANTPDFGEDGGSSIDSAYALSVSSAGADSGLDDTATGANVLLYLEGSQVVGRAGSAAGAIVFTVSVNATGTVTLDQQRAVVHADTSDHDDSTTLGAADLIRLTRTDTITDGDGDTNTGSAVLHIAQALNFEDDGPSIVVNTTAAADPLTVDETVLATNASADFSDNYANTPDFGEDGGSSIDSAYALSVSSAGADSGLDDTASGANVLLYLEGSQVVGRAGSAAGAIVFTVSVNATGTVTLDQQRAVVHADTSDHDDSTTLGAADLIRLTRTDTITDGDGDTNTGSAVLHIAQALNFEDDGPSITVSDTLPPDALAVDESVLGTNASASFADNFSNSPNYGADGAGSVSSAYALSVKSPGIASGLTDTASGQSVLLTLNGSGVVEGRTATSDVLVFTVSVDAAGLVTLDQIRAVVHADTTNHDDSRTLAAADLIRLTRTDTITDGDGDTASDDAVLHIAQALNFEDDGPSITAKTDLMYPNANNPTPGGTGTFAYEIGNDVRLAPFSSSNSDFSAITLSGTVGTTAITSPAVTWSSETATSAVFNFTFSYQPNPSSSNTTAATGTLTFDKLADTYTVALNAPVSGFTILTTSNALGFTGYTLNSSTVDHTQPDVSVAELANNFFVQFTGYSEPGGGTGANNLQALAPGAALGTPTGTAFINGELFRQGTTWVSVSNTANGTAGDTIQKGEVLDLDFFATNPTGFSSLVPTTQASGIFLKFDGIGSEDLVVVLKLIDSGGTRTTKAIIIDNADISKVGGPAVPAGFGIVLDQNDGAVVIESNDFNAAGETWLIEGAQLLVSTEGVTGNAINLNHLTGAGGGSSGTQAFGASTTDNDVIKISDIGFITANSGTLNANLSFAVAVLDKDGDSTSTQTLDVTIVGGTTFNATSDAETLQANGASERFVFDAVSDSPAGANRDLVTNFATGSDKIDLSGIDAVAGGSDDAFAYIGGAAFGSVAGQLRFDAATSLLQGDIDGNGLADFEIKLVGVVAPPPAGDIVV